MSDTQTEKPRGRGRPAMPEGSAKTSVITFKVSVNEREAIKRAIKRANMDKSTWMRQTILEAALAA